MAKKPPKDPPDGYDIGYGRPPKSGKWKPGQSGNPGGKKKGTKNGATIIREIMERKLKITEDGKSRKITVHEGLYLKCLDPALKGNLKFIAYLVQQLEQSETKEAKRKANRVVIRPFRMRPTRTSCLFGPINLVGSKLRKGKLMKRKTDR